MGKLIGISGGIGSGKSLISDVLRAIGYDVYDCDMRAKAIMDDSDDIKAEIADKISRDAINPDRSIDRKCLAAIVFNDKCKLSILNEIVHAKVREDLMRWKSLHSHAENIFVESAIMRQSGLYKIVDEVWEVTAPEEIRIERVCKRSHLDPKEVKARIESQASNHALSHPQEFMIDNGGEKSVLLQVHRLLNSSV